MMVEDPERTSQPAHEASESSELEGFGVPGAFEGLRYQPLMRLGRGGTAEVFLAMGRGPGGFDKLVVVKTLRPELANDEATRTQFLAEAQLCAQLNHPNVVQVYEVIDRPAAVLLVMEYLEGQTFAEVMRSVRPPQGIPIQMQILCDTLEGLHYSHELTDLDGTPLNLIHRDVNPLNVFVTCDGQVKVLDFGIAKISSSTKTQVGIIKGKIRYMPPEQLTATAFDRRGDVFSVGCMLWEAVTGRRLWGKLSDREVFQNLISGTLPKPSSVRAVDPELERIILRAIAPNPNQRYQTAADFQRDMEVYAAANYPLAPREHTGAHVRESFGAELRARKQCVVAALGSLKQYTEDSPDRISLTGLDGHLTDSDVLHAPNTLTDKQESSKGNAPSRFWRHGIAVAAMLIGSLALAATAMSWARDSTPATAQYAAADSNRIPTKIRVLVQANPEQATILLDGQALIGNPALVQLPPDSKNHRVEVSAPGYSSAQRTLRLDVDAEMTVTLVPTTALNEGNSPTATAHKTREGHRRPMSTSSGAPVEATAAAVPARPETAPGATSAPAGGVSTDCTPPYSVENGVRRYKPECL